MKTDMAQALKLLRKTLGLTSQQMAQQAGVDFDSYRYYANEGNAGKNDTPHKRRLQAFIDNHSSLLLNALNDDNAPVLHKNIRYSFEQGHCYRIFSSGYTGSAHGTPSEHFGGTSWEKDCIFVFLRKEGKHHVFRELHGGWTRTYTDPQLIGKKIIEVAHES